MPERRSAIRDAMNKLTRDGMRREYVGIKNYDSFGDQGSDHPYGMGPRHGSIVFAVNRSIRDRELTEQELEDALYYLNAYEQIEALEKDATST